MAPDNWTKLKWRLQAVANNEAKGGNAGVALVFVNVFLSGGVPIGWYKPQRVPLEPRNFDVSLLSFSHNGGDWDNLMRCFVPDDKKKMSGTIDRVLVVRDGAAIGWLDTI